MDAKLPLPALLSQAIVAFVIELDNEFEQRMPHTTSLVKTRKGPWLVSYAMWANCIRYVDDRGMSFGDLVRASRLFTNLDGMRRWGYITIEMVASDGKKLRNNDWVLRATPAAMKAREVWAPLTGEIEDRWKTRFGTGEVDRLWSALSEPVGTFDVLLPDYLPILIYGLANKVAAQQRGREEVASLSLVALLSKSLLSFALEFEARFEISLAICSNLLRVLGEEAVAVKELPALSGVSKEGISMGMGVLGKLGFMVLEPDSSGRGKEARLTRKGIEVKKDYVELVAMLENSWIQRHGDGLRTALEPLVGDGLPGSSPLFQGLKPYPDSWRAKVRPPLTLPHFPMVLHRGGYPDGS